MTNEDAIRHRFARDDIALARREGEILIGRTLRGLVRLTYEFELRRYRLWWRNAGLEVGFSGRAAAVEAELASIYDVVLA